MECGDLSPSERPMRLPRYIILVAIVPLILAGIVLLLALDPNGPSEYVAIGVLLGTIYAHTTLAASWTALGPFSLVARLPLSLAWLAAMVVGLAVNFAMHRAPGEASLLIGGL